MKWPAMVRIGWLDHILRAWAHDEGHKNQLHGQYYAGPRTAELLYEGDAPLSRQAHTILHELLHGIRECVLPSGWIESIRLTPNVDDCEEYIVSGISDGLCAAIRDNPVLWHKLVDALAGADVNNWPDHHLQEGTPPGGEST